MTLIAQIAFESLAVTTAMPTVARALDGLTLYALAFGATLATSMVGMVLSGQWSDARGPAAPLLTGIGWFVAGLLVAAFAPSMLVLIAGRAMQGLGSGMLIVALYVIVARLIPGELRPRVFALFAGAWVLPALVGPAIAGLIVETLGWRWVFLSAAILAVPATLLIRPALRDVRDPEPGAAPAQRRRLVWAVGAAASAGLLHYAGQAEIEGRTLLLLLATAGVVLFALELLPTGTIRLRRGLPAIIALRGVAAGAYVGAEVYIPLMLSTERGLSPTAAGLALTAGGVAWAAGSWYQGRARQRLSRTARIRVGMALTAFGIGLLMLVLVPWVPPWITAPAWACAGFGLGLVFPTLSVLTLELSPPAAQGANSSALQLSDAFVSTVALALGGMLFTALLPRSAPVAYLACFGVACLLALIGAFGAGRTRGEGTLPPARGPSMNGASN